MNIGQASKSSGISAKMIRHYESIDLVPKAGRTSGGYRDYSAADIHRLRFIRRARDLGFSFDQVRELLKLWSDKRRSSANVKRVALEHIAELEFRTAQLEDMIRTLKHLADACEGDSRPECPILELLESGNVDCCDEPKSGGKTPAQRRAGALS
jgi:Cu(I)-responsive transcriptional regulator